MHLLAAQPGGFVEEEGIIDLGQDPAKMVILAAADTSLAMLATATEQLSDEITIDSSSKLESPTQARCF